MDDRQFRRIIETFGLSWHGYRKVRKAVKKRIARHMQELNCRSVTHYLSVIESNRRLRAQSQRLLNVSISRFFRDREFWRALERSLFPEICRARKNSVRIWSAGCARGEEPYSIAIAWDVFAKRSELHCQLDLWATDTNPEWLSKAKAGVYARSSLKDMEPEVLETYFEPLPGASEYRVSHFVKKEIIWKMHDLATDDPPTRDVSVLFLRNNLLTYYNETIRKTVLEKTLESLASPGFLIIGSHERIPEEVRSLEPSAFHRLIFRKAHR
ncbi:MAG: CheR family methyltransferase [Deltaproteobacteria bacterium]